MCPEPPEELSGKTLATRFRLDARLLYTASSSLYRGHDLHGRADVAVKVLRPELDAGSEERFRREGRILAKIRHANIADFIDCGCTEDGLCYLVTALVDGRSLSEWCADTEPLALFDVWRIGLQLADALICAHSHGVIHRDVKASNVMWTAAGVVKLIDFGIAKLEPRSTVEVTPVRHPTVVGVPIGTPGYMPPEAGEWVDARTDIFGLGRTLYRLLTRRPVEHAPHGLEPTPTPLRRVVLQAAHADPEARIASAHEFRRLWLEAGGEVWPHHQPSTAAVLRPASQVWPPPPDLHPAPQLAALCSGAELGEPCTGTSPPRLFERRLELRTLLGDGRCGQTWRAYHHILGRNVAVKIVPRALAGTAVVSALCREAMALDKLEHRAFPRVFECDYAEDGSWYLVEELIDGETLSDTILKIGRPPLDPLAAVEIVAEIAEALCEAHARGILHGDIKANNLMLERTLPPRPRVIDLSECQLQEAFFAATDQRYAPTPLHRGDDGVTRGHPDFAAPELARGAPKTAATDVYALGVVLYMLITGERNGKALRGIFTEVEREDAGERLREQVIAAAPELEHTFLAADLEDILAPEPERRIATMAAFLEILRAERDALRDLRSPSAETPRPTRPSPPAQLPPPRMWPRWAAAAGAIGAVALAATWLSFQPARLPAPTPAVDPPSAPPTRPRDEPALPVQTSVPPASPPAPLTRSQLQAAVVAQIPKLSRCPDIPPRLTLTIDVGPRLALAEIEHIKADPDEPLDRCIGEILESLALPTSDTEARHIIELELDGQRR